MDYSPSGSFVHGIIEATILEWVTILQGIVPTKGSNPGLLHYRQILSQLSHQGSLRAFLIDGLLVLCLGLLFLLCLSHRHTYHQQLTKTPVCSPDFITELKTSSCLSSLPKKGSNPFYPVVRVLLR